MESKLKVLGFWPFSLGIGGTMISRRIPNNFEYINSRAAGLIGLMNAIKEDEPDILLCDFGPVDKVGFEHFKELRERNPKLAIVFCEITIHTQGWKKYSRDLQFVYYEMGPKWDMSGISAAITKAKELVD